VLFAKSLASTAVEVWVCQAVNTSTYQYHLQYHILPSRLLRSFLLLLELHDLEVSSGTRPFTTDTFREYRATFCVHSKGAESSTAIYSRVFFAACSPVQPRNRGLLCRLWLHAHHAYRTLSRTVVQPYPILFIGRAKVVCHILQTHPALEYELLSRTAH
jgi:hypothetical protein